MAKFYYCTFKGEELDLIKCQHCKQADWTDPFWHPMECDYLDYREVNPNFYVRCPICMNEVLVNSNGTTAVNAICEVCGWGRIKYEEASDKIWVREKRDGGKLK